ncbi:hypothetical protein J5N97_016366 [Dioscorea zingiberensis]|uniref:Uncharacterized protein n=1 Tax=Dioscorea zingiberensis TaxID=325984 RepID=A0A9D5HF43_9LILI|nr:hypothetical protein J5N97_016366 [Dioscorea zingiberensis]
MDNTDDAKLRYMVCKLQHIHHLLMGDGGPGPSCEVLHLYCLITRPVRMFIMIFYIENTPSSLRGPSNHTLTGKAQWDARVCSIWNSIEYMPKPYKFVVETISVSNDLCLEATNSPLAVKKMKYDTPELNVATRINESHGETSETGEKKNRVQYLQLIQKALEKMRTSSWFKHVSEVTETKLYTQLMEYVFSSMLVFQRRRCKPCTREREEKFHHEESEEMAYYRWASTEPGKLLHQEGSVPSKAIPLFLPILTSAAAVIDSVLGQIEVLLAEMVKDAFPFKWVRDNYSDPIMRETVGLSVAAKVVKSGFDFIVLDRMVALLFEVTELNDISSANVGSDGLA